MKALVKKEAGYGHMEVMDVEEPEIGPDQVKIEVKYAGVCGTDLHTYEGRYKVKAPVTLGHEFSGEVVAVGDHVTNVQVGDRVTSETTFYICGSCEYCKSGHYNLCSTRKGLGTQQNGGFAKYVVARKESVHRLPHNVDYLSAALTEPLACAHHAVSKAAVKRGEVAVVLGPGPIGLLTAQIAKSRGATVVITGLEKDKIRLDKALELGIDYVINIQSEDVKKLVDSLTEEYGADVVLECTGAVPAVTMGLDLLAKKGRYVQVGIFGTAEIPVDFEKIIQKEIKVIGCRSQNPFDWGPSLQLMNDQKVNAEALVTHRFDLSQWEQAFKLMKNGEAIKVVLTPLQ
ncbi:zinc-binding dehydrogenase [Paenibacillus sp. S150]|uniref:zinc-binding dehydrogenase n=1 Tax=Paenibacillus sp. S150 TaxID=2749826 RepID=UPI001C564199|nr:zinc-binding dehydrogenase [Paenibacillus sp. S150]MBW4081423.1 zinc-binding dehydrogenase [Paenibacillus sp. S150]